MTLCIGARCKPGVLCATDLAVSSGDDKQLLLGGKWFDAPEGVVMYAGTLYYVQEVQWSKAPTLREKLREVHSEHKDDDDEDSCELLVCTHDSITHYEKYGSSYARGDFACIGNGADIAGALLEMVYSPGRSEKWLLSHLKNIFRIVSRRRDGISEEFDYRLLETSGTRKARTS